ncbi:hypothetical protein GCM10025784_29070 [Citricoccus nitrophenolicus]
MVRRLAHEPFGWRPTVLEVSIHRYRCTGCGHVWGIYQRMIAAYREPDRTRGRELMRQLLESIGRGVPSPFSEIITLGRNLTKRAADLLAYFDRPGTSNGPTGAINGRLEYLTRDRRLPTPTTPPMVKGPLKAQAPGGPGACAAAIAVEGMTGIEPA